MLFSSLLVAALAQVTSAKPGDGDWKDAYAKARTAMLKLSNKDKVGMVTGIGWTAGPCVGNTGSVPAIGYPSLCLQDSPLGVRFAQGITAFPAGVQVATTWDTGLMNQRGAAMGAESKGKGVNVQLGPVAGPLGKFPAGGRNWEGFSPDPYLTGIAMAQTIKGIQASGVQACAKHFIGNEQELNRNEISSVIDDRTMHELYLWPFADAIRANVASVMCSYNRVNGTYACENGIILNMLLKEELDFQGYVVSDWTAQHTTVGSALAGMDMSMPGSGFGDRIFLWGDALLAAIVSGQVPQSRLDDMVLRILASWYFVGQDQGYPPVLWSSWDGGAGGPDVQSNHKTVARAIARDGIVLLKNTNNALPLKKPASLAVIGTDAITNPAGPNACSDRGCDTGTLAMGWGSGTAQFPYLVSPSDAIKVQAASDGTKVTTSTTDDTIAAAAAAAAAETAIVFINADSGEGYITVEGVAGDRNNLDPWHNGNQLVAAVAAVNKKTVVVIHSVGALILESFIDLPNVVAVVWAGIPGQESGNGLVDILYGSTNPSGKLPYTIAKSPGDYGTNVVGGTVDTFPEGLFIDYRHFDQAGIEPRFEFGYGLSYTTFKYSNLIIEYPNPGPGAKAVGPGGAESLYHTVATIKFTVTNTGSVQGQEVAQLYIGLPPSAPATPPKQLRGFEKVGIYAGASRTVTFAIHRKDVSYWDVASQTWITPSGKFNIMVGSSSRDIRLVGTM